MVAVPASAFEVYQQMKSSKKKSSKRKNRNKKKDPVKVTSNVSEELLKVIKIKPGEIKENKPHASTKGPRELRNGANENAVEINEDRSKPSTFKISETSKFDNPLITVVEAPTKMKKKSSVDAGEPSNLSKKMKKKKEKVKNTSPVSQVNLKALKTEVSPQPRKSQELCLSNVDNSVVTAEKFFLWLMNPIGKEDFMKLYWEKRPVHISREQNRDYYKDILSTSAIDEMFRKHNILYGKNVDITSYIDGKRETLNSVGRAHAAVVWDYYRNGCSVRLLNPQTYHVGLRELNTWLQECFGSFVGANAYLTPPNSQGFAPHYDDIEAFVLQVEGSKKWRVYAPRDPSERLPRTSSPNFSQEEIGEPILEVHVKAGDLLYFPRGFIHQATTVPGEHSLHVTVSTYQRNSWADFFEKLVPAALANAIEEDEDFRKGMPLDAMNHIGAAHSDLQSTQRLAILKKVEKLFSKLVDHAPVDAAADQMAKDFIHDALPPFLTPAEKKCSVLENSERMVGNGKLQGTVQVSLKTCIRLTRSNVLRLVSEEDPDTMKIYHSMENSLEYHGEDLQCIDIPLHLALAVEHLIHAFPAFTAISDLPLEKNADKIQIAAELWERGLVLTDKPLPGSSSINDN